MTLIDLIAALHRLLDDPRTSPHTPVRLQYEVGRDYDDPHIDEDPLIAVAIKDHAVILSATHTEPALAR